LWFITKVLELDIEAGLSGGVGREDVAQPKQDLAGVVEVAGIDEVADFTVAAAGEADETSGVGAKGFESDKRWSLTGAVGEVGCRDKATEIGIALAVLSEED